MKCPKRLFDSIACDSISPFRPSSKGNTYVLTCMCLLMNYPIAVSILNNMAKLLSKPEHVYATIGCSLTLITGNGKEPKNELFQKLGKELGIKHQFFYSLPSKIKWHFRKIPFMSKGLC